MVGTFVQAYAVLVIFWVALNGLNAQEVLFGLVACLPVAWLTRDKMFTRGILEKLQPRRLLHAVAYIPTFLWLELIAHLHVFKMIVTGKIYPDIVRVPLFTKRYISITGVGNSITLTPGTLTLTAKENCLYVHTIDKRQDVVGGAKAMENHLEGVFK